jgi:hypothetical protein
MIKVILQVILAIVLFRLIGSLVRLFRGRDNRSDKVGARPDPQSVDNGGYEELTPYDIEDADYEELPRGK